MKRGRGGNEGKGGRKGGQCISTLTLVSLLVYYAPVEVRDDVMMMSLVFVPEVKYRHQQCNTNP